jgi:hypothetical protein
LNSASAVEPLEDELVAFGFALAPYARMWPDSERIVGKPETTAQSALDMPNTVQRFTPNNLQSDILSAHAATIDAYRPDLFRLIEHREGWRFSSPTLFGGADDRLLEGSASPLL